MSSCLGTGRFHPFRRSRLHWLWIPLRCRLLRGFLFCVWVEGSWEPVCVCNCGSAPCKSSHFFSVSLCYRK